MIILDVCEDFVDDVSQEATAKCNSDMMPVISSSYVPNSLNTLPGNHHQLNVKSKIWFGDKSQIPKSDNSSQVAVRPILKRRQFVPFLKSDNSSQNCLIDQLINNLLKIEIKELNKLF